MPRNSVAGRPGVFGQIIGAKQSVEEWKMNCEVHVHRGWFDSVVPVMEARADQDFFKQWQSPAEVRVNERRIDINQEDVAVHFDQLIDKCNASGRFNNKSEVIRAGLRLLEEHEATAASASRGDLGGVIQTAFSIGVR